MAVGKSHRPIFIGLCMAAVLSAASLSGRPADPAASPALAPAFVPQRGGGGGGAPQTTSTVPELKFRYMGPPSAGRIAVGRRRARRHDDLLRGRGVGRRVEIDRQRDRRSRRSSTPAGAGHRRARGRAVGSEQGVGGHGRGVGHPRQRHQGRRHVQVHRRRRDVEEHGPEGDGPHRPDHRPPEESRHRLGVRRSAAPPGPQEERGVYSTTDGGATWQRCSSSIPTRAVGPRDGRVRIPTS